MNTSKLTEAIERDASHYLNCVSHGVTPLTLSSIPFNFKGWVVRFKYKFEPEKSREAAFAYLKSVFCAKDMEAYTKKDTPAGEFFVRFNVNYRQMMSDGSWEPCQEK